MKKLLCALAVLITVLSFCGGRCAQAEKADEGSLISLPALRQETVNVWQEDITNIRGETVSIDAEILVPEVPVFPVVMCEYVPLEETYSREAVLQEAIDPSQGTMMLLRENAEGLIYYERRPLLANGQAENSPISSDEAFQIALDLIHQCHPGAQFINAGVLAYGRAYKTRSNLPGNYHDAISCAAEMLDFDMPLDDKGLYKIWLLPDLEGIPIHDTNIPKSYASIQDGLNFFVSYQPYRLTQSIMDDIPLCPWSVIQEAIREEIESGRLRDVYSIRLCYMEMFKSTDQYTNWHRNSDFTRVAAPMWVIHGELYDSAQSEPTAVDAAMREWPDYVMEQRVLQQSSLFMLIHPQTGEVLGSEYQNGKLNPKAVVAPTYIGWDGVRR